MRLALALAITVTAFGQLSAQDVGVPAPAAQVGQEPSVRRPPPFNYFLRSLLLPGWGQASLNRKLTGGLFVAFEGVALGMTLKSIYELRYLQRINSDLVETKRAERQDWIVLMAANHLFAGLEAFVSAALFDFPADLGFSPGPDGRPRFGVSVRILR